MEGFFFTCALLLILAMLFAIGSHTGKSSMKQSAVERGHAEWITEDGNTQRVFSWNDEEPCW
jgi:hypothetical protein